MAARIAEIADALVTSINGATFSQAVTAVRSYQPDQDLKETQDASVSPVTKVPEVRRETEEILWRALMPGSSTYEFHVLIGGILDYAKI